VTVEAANTAEARRRRWPRRLALGSGAVIVGLLLATGWLALGTSYESQGLAFVHPRHRRPPPGWTQPCWRRGRGRFRVLYTLPCARVEGRVIFRQGHDPDGDGDAHVVVIAGPHIVTIKIPRDSRAPRTPGLGARIRVTGLLSHGRLGLPVITAVAWGH
jgi:hypothetical protein